jgi:predicted transcriptional regulator YheO
VTTKDQFLREKTHKDDGVDVDRRVFYTLRDDKQLQTHRNSKAIALVMQRLYDKGIFSAEDIDDVLFDCVG